MQARHPFGQPLDGVAPNFRERCNVIGKFMRGCRKERSPAGRPDNNAGHAEWSLHPHAHRTAVGTEKHSVGTALPNAGFHLNGAITALRSEEHTSELQSLMRISYAVFCLKKKNRNQKKQSTT